MFGPLTVVDGEHKACGRELGGAKLRDLLAILLLARGHPVSKDALADSLWGEALPKNVAGTLEQYVCMLRRRLFCDPERARRVIVTEYNAYRLDASEESVDLDRFDELLVRAEHAPVPDRRVLLEQAVELACGDLVEDAPYASWIEPHREVYRHLVARARLWLAHDCVLAGDFVAAIRHSEIALHFAPYSEQAFRTIMLSDHALGHQDLARATYVRCRDLLADSLDTDPTTETAQLASAIDAGAPLSSVIDAFVALRCPNPQQEPMMQMNTDRGVAKAHGRNRMRVVLHRTSGSATALPAGAAMLRTPHVAVV
ncbi:MAG TPA: BTAD domain-containing putative transcriptional regulator [Ilumatobacteraceae bacterium]|nr:BTAD domain-containing putative transcriptional regulator [Ilumatobacteraceae bacterium]